MRGLVVAGVAAFLVFPQLSCKPQPSSISPPQSTTPEEFETLVSKALAQISAGNRPFRDPEVERMLRVACSAPRHFDRLLVRVADAPDPALSSDLFGYGNMGMKDCPLGEDYVVALSDRILKEEHSKPRQVIRNAIQWHVFHEHARKWSTKAYAESVAAKVRPYVRRDAEDDRWYGVMQAIYAPCFPEAAAEMWRAVRTDAESVDNSLAIGAFETSFNHLDKTSWKYRDNFLEECLKFIAEARSLENPTAAGWMLKRAFANYARNGKLTSAQVLKWESALLETAMKARSQAHRGEAVLVLLSMGSLRGRAMLNDWLRQELPDGVIDSFLRELSIVPRAERDLLLEVEHPRLRARLEVDRELAKRNWTGEPSAVTYLLGVLRDDPKPEMRQEALHDLAYTLRDDPRDGNEGLPQGMSHRLDLLDIVLADPSPKVRHELARALKQHEEHIPDLDRDRQSQIRRLFDSIK